MKTTLVRLPLLALLISLAACDKKSPAPGSTDAPKAPAATSSSPSPAAPASVTSVRQTSFAEVTSQLDPGGNLFVYLSTDQWLAGLTTNIAQLHDLLTDFPAIDADKHDLVDRGFNLLTNAVKGSGIETLTGVGLSAIQLTPDLHRTKLILHHAKGQGDGLLWNVMGKQSHALTAMDLLTTNTAFAAFGDFDLKAIWGALENGIGNSGIPEAAEGVKKFPELFEQQTKVPWSKFMASLGGELGIVFTLNDARKLIIPLGETNLAMPTPGLLIAVKVNDDLIYNRVSSELKQNQQVQITEEKGLKLCVMPLPIPLPIDVQITVASIDGYFLIASSPNLVRDVVAVRAGTVAGLRQSAEFVALQKYLPAEGNQFVYLDRRISGTIRDVQRQMVDSEPMDSAQKQFIEKMLLNRDLPFGLSIGAHTETGWQNVSVGNRNASTAFLAAPAIPVVAIAAAIVLPGLAKAKDSAQSITCVNNMKQQNLAFRMWALDHDDKFPFNVSTNKGGTLELCEPGADGYDQNSFRHFQVMSNELFTPKLLVCPMDKTTIVAENFTDLQPPNLSYQVRSGTNVNDMNPTEVILYCPIHHHTGYTDGSVKKGDKD